MAWAGDGRVELLALERLLNLEGRFVLTGWKRPSGSVVLPPSGVTLRVFSYNPLIRLSVRQKRTETPGAMILRALALVQTRAKEHADQKNFKEAIRRQRARKPSKGVN